MADPTFNPPITNPFGLSDVGSINSPTFADIDGDGDLDAFVGNGAGNTLFFRNTGTASAPTFAAPVTNPFGLSNLENRTTPTFADIDGDGDLDAFIGRNTGDIVFFRNTGTASAPTFAAAVNNPFGLSDVGSLSAPTLADIDGDGDLDAFVGNSEGNTLFFRNTGSASTPSFAAPVTNPFGLSNAGLFVTPTLADIDGDGDLDAFVGNNTGNTLFFRNTGTSAAPNFASPVTNPFGLSDVGTLSAPTFADIDGDGDLDAFVGNGLGNTLFFRNAPPRVSIAPGTTPSEAGTTPANGSFVLTLSDPAPAGGLTVTYTVGGTATPGSDYTPLTGSVTVAAGATTASIPVIPILDNVVDPSETIRVMLTATSTSPYILDTSSTAVLRIADQVPLSFAAPITNPFGLGDVGSFIAPTFADIDGDGDLDAFVGNQNGNTLFYRNNGTAATPSFAAPITNPFGLSDVGYLSTPTFADIDGDGDLDAFVGSQNGNTLFFRNTGSASAPSFAVAVTNPFGLSDVGVLSSPSFADIDGDGDLDAFVGNSDGNTVFYRNNGTAAAPSFAAPITNPFGLSDVGASSSPTFADIDGDGDLDALVGNSDGNTVFYRNNGTAAAPSFAAPITNPFGLSDVGASSSPTFADIDGDGDLDAFVGARDGSIRFFENAPTVSVTAGGNAAEPGTAGSFTLTLSQAAPDGGITVSYTLSGTATNGTDYTVPLTTTIAAGQTTATVTVTPIDDALVEGTETITLTLTDAPRYNLGATATATATINLTDNDTLPIVTIAATDAAAAEAGSEPGTFRFSRTGATTAALTVSYTVATGAGQASNGTDYTPTLTGSIVIPVGASFIDFSITPVDDALIEGSETVTLTLIDAPAYDLGAAATQTATVTIADNDTAGFTLSKTTATVSESGTTDSFTVVLNAQPTTDVVFSVASSDPGEATAAPTLLTFTNANWNIAQTVTITGVDDALIDGSQTSSITVSVVDASSNDAFDGVADQTVSVTTLDDDLPTLSINDVSVAEGDSGVTTASFTVSLSEAVTTAVTLNYATADGTATAGSDYTAIGLTPLVFEPGQTSKTIEVSILGDTLFEPDETFVVNLTGVVGATLADAQGTVIIRNDDANVINGTGGRDTLIGTANSDLITGFAGADTITTGAGNDRIVYTNLRDAGDVIKDFAVGFDQLVLTQLLDSLVAGGYGGTNAITDGYVRFAASGNNTLVQIDPDGLGTAATARNFLTLEGVAVAAANDPNNFVF